MTAPATAWEAPPVLEGPSYAPPRTALEEARVAALNRDGAVDRQLRARFAHVEARHDYEERVRRADAEALRSRLTRLEERRDRAEPLLRDAVVGGTAITAPLLLATSNGAVRPELRQAAVGMALLLGLLAGREWMTHQHEHRITRLEDEAERIQGRLAVRAIPLPAEFPPLDLR